MEGKWGGFYNSRLPLEEILESLGNALEGQESESREIKCISMGDDYCAFVVKFKPKGALALDWKELEGKWGEYDAIDLRPET